MLGILLLTPRAARAKPSKTNQFRSALRWVILPTDTPLDETDSLAR